MDYHIKKERDYGTILDLKETLCNKECKSFVNGRHISNCGLCPKKKINNFTNTSLKERYRIPYNLIKNWINKMEV
jgi:hypothetical protein